MRLCEISNPSDPYTIEVDDDPRPACAAVLLLARRGSTRSRPV